MLSSPSTTKTLEKQNIEINPLTFVDLGPQGAMHHLRVIPDLLLELLLELLLGALAFEEHLGHLVERQVVHLDTLHAEWGVHRGHIQGAADEKSAGGGARQRDRQRASVGYVCAGNKVEVVCLTTRVT